MVIEATYVDPAGRDVAASKGHTHIDEVGAAIARRGEGAPLPDDIVLKHFSMKVTPDMSAHAVERAIPPYARGRIRVLAADDVLPPAPDR